MIAARCNSAGRRALVAYLQADDASGEALAKACAAWILKYDQRLPPAPSSTRKRTTTRAAISALATGATRTPTLKLALALKAIAGIEPEMWIEPPLSAPSDEPRCIVRTGSGDA
ncbi:MAG TPA: hypothetical protein VF407_11035 [Polyangiaceae bacterium]